MSSTDGLGVIAELLQAAGRLEVHDVSPPIGPDLPIWFMHPPAQVDPVFTHDEVGAATNLLTLSDHTGTHVDAPYHFDADGSTVDQLPADVLFLRPYRKYDLSANDHQAGELIGVDDLRGAEQAQGFELDEGEVAIVEVGWDRQLAGGEAGRDADYWGRNQPGLSLEACEYLASKKPVAVASDTAACDVAAKDGEQLDAHGHTNVFLPSGILIVECLRGLAAVPDRGLFVALPLKIEGASASPVRVLLLTE